jgi:hypothetical protein
VKRYRKSAQQGLAIALFNLGHMSRKGPVTIGRNWLGLHRSAGRSCSHRRITQRAQEHATCDGSPADRLSSNTPSFSKTEIIKGVAMYRTILQRISIRRATSGWVGATARNDERPKCPRFILLFTNSAIELYPGSILATVSIIGLKCRIKNNTV